MALCRVGTNARNSRKRAHEHRSDGFQEWGVLRLIAKTRAQRPDALLMPREKVEKSVRHPLLSQFRLGVQVSSGEFKTSSGTLRKARVGAGIKFESAPTAAFPSGSTPVQRCGLRYSPLRRVAGAHQGRSTWEAFHPPAGGIYGQRET